MDKINRTRKSLQKLFTKKGSPAPGRPRMDPEGRLLSERITHTTIRIDRDILEKMKTIARIEKTSFREVMEIFCRKGIALYEEKHGRIENPRGNGREDII